MRSPDRTGAPDRSGARDPAGDPDRTGAPDRTGEHDRAILWTMIAAGSAIRLVLAFATKGLPYDIHSFELVRAALSRAPLHLYAQVNPAGNFHWPYPSGFLPFVAAASGLANLVGGDFTHLIRVPAIAADAALAWLVWRGLEERLDRRARLLAAALVTFGPVFITISGYAAQIDAVAILPAVAALLVWERPTAGRAWKAGVLIGVAAAIKSVPLLMVLALAPSARSWREGIALAASAVGVLVVAMAPFLAVDSSSVLELRHYTGSPGLGGLSLVVQPDLAKMWLIGPVGLSAASRWLFVEHPSVLNGLIVVLFVGLAGWTRPRPRLAAALLWLIVLAFGSGFFFQYLVWLLPFLLLAGYRPYTAALQLLILAPMLIFYDTAWRSTTTLHVYVAIMLAVFLAWVLKGAEVVRGARLHAAAATRLG